MVIITLPSIYVEPDPGGPKPLKGLHYLGPHRTLEGHSQAMAVFKASKLEIHYLFILTWLPSIDQVLFCLTSIPKGPLKRTLRE